MKPTSLLMAVMVGVGLAIWWVFFKSQDTLHAQATDN